jgi:hypothetical protein
MDITHTLKKTTTGALVSGAVAVAIWGWLPALPRQTLSLKAHFSGAQGSRCRRSLGTRPRMWCGTTVSATRIGGPSPSGAMFP